MEPTDLIDDLQSHLDSRMQPEVIVPGSEQRPVPGVIIEDWSVTHLDGSMTRYLTSLYDDQGNETARVYRIPYDCRVSIMVRDVGEIGASRLNDSLGKELMRLEARPQRLNDSVSMVEMQGGRGIDHQFVNPSEAEFHQSVTLTTSLVYEDTTFDTIETITSEIEIVDTI